MSHIIPDYSAQTPGLIIRKATPADAEDVAKAVISAGSTFLPWLFGPRYKEIVYECANGQNNTFSWTNATVAEWQGKVAGVVISYPGEKEKEMDRELSLILRKYHNIVSLFFFIRKAKKAVHYFNKPAKSYYILAIAVFEDFRGKDICAQLISHVEAIARHTGHSSLALEVEGFNYSAIRAYQKCGFTKIREVPLERFSKSLKINRHSNMWIMRKKLV